MVDDACQLAFRYDIEVGITQHSEGEIPLALAGLTVKEDSDGVGGYLRMLKGVPVEHNGAGFRAKQESPGGHVGAGRNRDSSIDGVEQSEACDRPDAEGHRRILENVES